MMKKFNLPQISQISQKIFTSMLIFYLKKMLKAVLICVFCEICGKKYFFKVTD